jgi:hypothetical protein
LTAIVTELSTSARPPPQFQPANGGGRKKEEQEEELDLGEDADSIFASILAGQNNVKLKKKTTTTTVKPKETTTTTVSRNSCSFLIRMLFCNSYFPSFTGVVTSFVCRLKPVPVLRIRDV